MMIINKLVGATGSDQSSSSSPQSYPKKIERKKGEVKDGIVRGTKENYRGTTSEWELGGWISGGSNTLKKNKEEKTNKKWKWKKDVKHVLVRGNWYKVIESRRSEIQKKSRRKKVKRWKWGKDIKHDLFNAKWGRLLCMIIDQWKPKMRKNGWNIDHNRTNIWQYMIIEVNGRCINHNLIDQKLLSISTSQSPFVLTSVFGGDMAWL